MLRPVELGSAGNPRTAQADQRRLDDMLAVEEVVAVGFVEPDLDTPAEFRQDHELDVLVLQHDRLIGPVEFFLGNAVSQRVGIDPSTAALVVALIQEHRIEVRRRRRIGGEHDLLDTRGHSFTVHLRSSSSKVFRIQNGKIRNSFCSFSCSSLLNLPSVSICVISGQFRLRPSAYSLNRFSLCVPVGRW